MVVHALHPEISELASRRRVDGGQFGSGVGADSLLLLAPDARCLWRRLVLGLVLFVSLFLIAIARRSAGSTEAGLILALEGEEVSVCPRVMSVNECFPYHGRL